MASMHVLRRGAWPIRATTRDARVHMIVRIVHFLLAPRSTMMRRARVPHGRGRGFRMTA